MSAPAPIRRPAPSAGGELTLADLTLLPSLAGCRVLPSRADLGRPVRSVVLADPAGPEEPDALVVSAGAPPAELPEGCAGVVCRSAPAGSERPEVPVLVLPAGARWGAVLADLHAALSDGARLGHAAAARAALRVQLVDGEGFPGLAGVACELLAAPVAILDEHLDLLATAGMGEQQDQVLAAAVGRARGHGPASVLGPFLEDDMPGVTRALVRGGGAPIGALAAWLPGPLSGAEEAALAELADACGLERAREQVRTETESRLRGDLIEELMAGGAVSRDSVVRRARHLGADLAGGAVALLGKLSDPHTEGRSITDPRLVRRFLQQARATVDLHCPRALVDWSEGRLLALLPAGRRGSEPAVREEVEAEALTVGKRLLAATGQTVPGLALTLAISRFTPEPERLGAALDEARLALSIGERLGRVGEVVTFEETGTYKLLFQIFADRPEELASFYDQTLAPLVAYDEQYQTELVATLSTYLGHDCNLAATASTLYTHRHTVRYRLDRIAGLSGLDISKTDDREKLSLGLKAMRLLGRRVATAGEHLTRRGRAG